MGVAQRHFAPLSPLSNCRSSKTQLWFVQLRRQQCTPWVPAAATAPTYDLIELNPTKFNQRRTEGCKDTQQAGGNGATESSTGSKPHFCGATVIKHSSVTQTTWHTRCTHHSFNFNKISTYKKFCEPKHSLHDSKTFSNQGYRRNGDTESRSGDPWGIHSVPEKCRQSHGVASEFLFSTIKNYNNNKDSSGVHETDQVHTSLPWAWQQ